MCPLKCPLNILLTLFDKGSMSSPFFQYSFYYNFKIADLSIHAVNAKTNKKTTATKHGMMLISYHTF